MVDDGDGATRLEVTVHPRGDEPLDIEGISALDLDRIPDPEGGVRLLVSREELEGLTQRGFEVRVVAELAVEPLDPSLVVEEDAAVAWLEEQVKGIEREGER
jgi:hypothetical protein